MLHANYFITACAEHSDMKLLTKAQMSGCLKTFLGPQNPRGPQRAYVTVNLPDEANDIGNTHPPPSRDSTQARITLRIHYLFLLIIKKQRTTFRTTAYPVK